MADRTGQQLGNYRLVRFLGHGGFADVYLGEHRYLKSYAALKVLRTSLKGKEIENFLSEAQTLVRLRHPNIVRVLEFAVERGTPVLVMDYAPGGTVRKHYPRGSILPLATTVAYARQVATALQYAHNHNIIHRDVKPENILFGSDRQLLLSDFGLALLSTSPELLRTQEMAGTLPYTAPEQLRGKPSFASDQYALGIIVYEWLCGRRPFEGNQWELINQHVSVAPAPLRKIFPELPAAVEEVVLIALAKDPQQRFASVQAFARALEQASQESDAGFDDDSELAAPLKQGPSPQPITSPDRTARRIFLSAAPADDVFVARLKVDLEKRGILIWDSRSANTPHKLNQEDAARQGIRAAQMALIVLSPNTRSSQVITEHLRIASMYERQLVFVWLEGDDLAAILPDAWGKATTIDLVDARQSRYEDALDEIVSSLAHEEEITAPLEPSLEETSREPRNPYKGLHAFTKDDTLDFFGRDALIQELVETTRGMLAQGRSRLLAVIGPSGSGKSSVVMAGLLPRLQKNALAGSAEWVYLEPIVPGRHPLESLLLTLAPHLPNMSLKAMREDLEEEAARGLYRLTTRLVKHPETKVVLVIDQFEELFTQSITEAERQRFIKLLVTAVTEPQSPLFVILTLRADFYDRPLFYPALGRLIQHRHHVVYPMELPDLRAVIEQPAALPDVQLTFEGDLIGDLLFEVQGQAGALPLLEFTLDQLFQRREGHWLTLQAYQEIGGVKGALAKHAEFTYASLPSEEHRRLARALFLRLIDPGAAAQDTTRRRAVVTELSLPDPKETRIMQEAAFAFVAARLLTTNVIAGSTTIEVSHEALIREWARLAEWLREAREDIALQQALSADAAEWIRRGKPADRVYRGSQFTEAQAWAERNVPSADEVAFLSASAAERQQQEETALKQKVRELSLQRRAISRQRLLIAALSIFSVIVIVLASIAEVSRQQAETQAQISLSRALAANATSALLENKLDLALLLSVQATQIDETTYEARDSLLSALENSPQIVTMLRSGNSDTIATLAFGSDNRLFVSSDTYKVYVWDTHTNTRARPLRVFDKQDYVGGIALSPDNRTLGIASAGGVWLWDTQTGALIATLDGKVTSLPTGLKPFTPIAFSQDGQYVTSARCSQYDSNESTICIKTQISTWNVESKQRIGLPYIIPVNAESVAFSPDGTELAASNGSAVQTWNVTTGQTLGPNIANSNNSVTSLAFSPDNTKLAVSSNTSIQLWSVRGGQPLGPPLTGHADTITGVAFNSHGTKLASSSLDNTVRVWDVASGDATSGQTLLTLHGDALQKWSVAFGPDGTTLASGSNDGTVLFWNIDATSAISQPLANTGVLQSPVFSKDGTTLLAGSTDGKIVQLDLRTRQLTELLDTTSYVKQKNIELRPIESLALSSDGATLAIGRLDGTIILWDMKMKKPLAPFLYPGKLSSIMLSSDGRILAADGSGGKTVLWNVAKRSMFRSVPYPASESAYIIPPTALSPDGNLLAVGSCGKIQSDSCAQGQVQLWDVGSGKVTTLSASQPAISGVAFSPDGTVLAASTHKGIVLWNVKTRTTDGQMLVLPSEATCSDCYDQLLFSPNGKVLASYSVLNSPFNFVLWDMALQEPLAGPIAQEGFNQGSIAFSPDGQQLISASVSASTSLPGEGVVTQWNITIELWRARACSIANRNLSPVEWKQFVPGKDYSKVCPGLAT